MPEDVPLRLFGPWAPLPAPVAAQPAGHFGHAIFASQSSPVAANS